MADETMTDEQILESVEHKSFAATSDRTAASLSASGVAAEDVARAAAQAAYDKKGEDVQVLDLTELSDVCDYFVLATGTNNRQVDSIVDEIEEKVAESCGEHPFSIEGREQKTWMLMDYGSVVVHVFTPEAREFYRLEKLWGDAPPALPRPSLAAHLGQGFLATLNRLPDSCTTCNCPVFFLTKKAYEWEEKRDWRPKDRAVSPNLSRTASMATERSRRSLDWAPRSSTSQNRSVWMPP